MEVNCTTVAALMECLAGSWSCPMFAESFPGVPVPEFPANYAGVYNGWGMTLPIKFVQDWGTVHSALANPAGER